MSYRRIDSMYHCCSSTVASSKVYMLCRVFLHGHTVRPTTAPKVSRLFEHSISKLYVANNDAYHQFIGIVNAMFKSLTFPFVFQFPFPALGRFLFVHLFSFPFFLLRLDGRPDDSREQEKMNEDRSLQFLNR